MSRFSSITFMVITMVVASTMPAWAWQPAHRVVTAAPQSAVKSLQRGKLGGGGRWVGVRMAEEDDLASAQQDAAEVK